jgi:hypothetical protein
VGACATRGFGRVGWDALRHPSVGRGHHQGPRPGEPGVLGHCVLQQRTVAALGSPLVADSVMQPAALPLGRSTAPRAPARKRGTAIRALGSSPPTGTFRPHLSHFPFPQAAGGSLQTCDTAPRHLRRSKRVGVQPLHFAAVTGRQSPLVSEVAGGSSRCAAARQQQWLGTREPRSSPRGTASRRGAVHVARSAPAHVRHVRPLGVRTAA